MGPEFQIGSYRLWFVLESCGIVCSLIVSFVTFFSFFFSKFFQRCFTTMRRNVLRQSSQGMIVIWMTDYVVTRVVLEPWYEMSLKGYVLVGLMHLLAGSAFACHVRVMFTCPGVRKRNTLTSEEVQKHLDSMSLDLNPTRVCGHCKAYKPNRVHHCRQCNRCVDRMDHHCPWVNNCIGQYNQKYFLLFLFYVILGEMYALALTFTRGYVCVKRKDCEDPIEPMGPLVCIFMTIVSVFFLIFVCTMGCEQYDAIHDDLSSIDRLQHRYVSLCVCFDV